MRMRSGLPDIRSLPAWWVSWSAAASCQRRDATDRPSSGLQCGWRHGGSLRASSSASWASASQSRFSAPLRLGRRFIAASPRRLQIIGKPIDSVGFHRVCDRDRIDDVTSAAFKYPVIEPGRSGFDLHQRHSEATLRAPGTFDRRQGRPKVVASASEVVPHIQHPVQGIVVPRSCLCGTGLNK
jgi:hypothetical protein